MKNGQEVVFKVYVDGEEDPSWRVIARGKLVKRALLNSRSALPIAITLCWRLAIMWLRCKSISQLAQRGYFSVLTEE